MKYIVTFLSTDPDAPSDSDESSIVLRSILAGVSEDRSSITSAQAAIDDFLKGSINLHGLNGDNDFRLDEEVLTEFSSYKVGSAGDFNGDGFDDMIIGADHHSPDTVINDTGYIVFRKPSEFGATLNLSDLDSGNGFRIHGISGVNADEFLISQAGDVNADGFDDLIIGSIAYNLSNNRPDSAYVIFGRAAAFGRTAAFDAPLDLSNLSSSDGFRIDGLNLGEDLRHFVSSAEDFNGDGYSDIIIGSPMDETSYLVLGKSTGFDAVLDL